MKTLIMAGGKGTRIASVASDIPKPMIRLCGKPILEYQIACLVKNGLFDIIMVVGHLGDAIQKHFGDGSAFGCTISYYVETEPLGTAGALYKLKGLGDDLILIHGDLIFDVDFSRFIGFHRRHMALATLAAHPNSHPFDSALLITDGEHRVRGWLNKEDTRTYYKNQVNAGLHILSTRLLDAVKPASPKVDLDRDILKPLINASSASGFSSGAVYAYNTPEYIKDMGTPERYAQVSADITAGFVAQRNLAVQQRAVFLDRDGTINTFNGFVTRPEDFTLIDGAAEAIRAINSAGYLAIVISNQPIIARGEASIEDLEAIHDKMETELGRVGAFVDDIFYCPHHPDRGFPGERPEYKVDCGCRKPKPGMILAAAEKYNIDLARSWMVGDDMRDVRAGLAAGCSVALLSSDQKGAEELAEVPVFPDLGAFVRTLLAAYNGSI
jgi:D,D-heptose 1,7-bisphosphate phosphatase